MRNESFRSRKGCSQDSQPVTNNQATSKNRSPERGCHDGSCASRSCRVLCDIMKNTLPNKSDSNPMWPPTRHVNSDLESYFFRLAKFFYKIILIIPNGRKVSEAMANFWNKKIHLIFTGNLLEITFKLLCSLW